MHAHGGFAEQGKSKPLDGKNHQGRIVGANALPNVFPHVESVQKRTFKNQAVVYRSRNTSEVSCSRFFQTKDIIRCQNQFEIGAASRKTGQLAVAGKPECLILYDRPY